MFITIQTQGNKKQQKNVNATLGKKKKKYVSTFKFVNTAAFLL